MAHEPTRQRLHERDRRRRSEQELRGTSRSGPAWQIPPPTAVLDENSLQLYPGVPRAPVYEWHGSADPVSLGAAQQLAGRYCAAGLPVLFDVIAGADHGTAIAPGGLRALGYLADRFAGVAPPSNC